MSSKRVGLNHILPGQLQVQGEQCMPAAERREGRLPRPFSLWPTWSSSTAPWACWWQRSCEGLCHLHKHAGSAVCFGQSNYLLHMLWNYREIYSCTQVSEGRAGYTVVWKMPERVSQIKFPDFWRKLFKTLQSLLDFFAKAHIAISIDRLWATIINLDAVMNLLWPSPKQVTREAFTSQDRHIEI